MTASVKTGSSLAVRRLHEALVIWELEKRRRDCQWLYVCARRQGEKLRALWIASAEVSLACVERGLGDAYLAATSFELEILHSPEIRSLSSARKNQWNSLRGVRAISIEYESKVSRWAATDMISRNLSFNHVLNRHLSTVRGAGASLTTIPVTLYQTIQLFCDNSQRDRENSLPARMFRGNQVIRTEDVCRESVVSCLQGMTRWLASQVGEDGAANYKYWPSRGAYATSNNAIRQWMATVCLGRAASFFKNEGLASTAAKNLAHNVSVSFKREGQMGYIWMNGSAKLGAAGLAALAIFESPLRKQFLSEEYALFAFMDLLSNPDGSFDTFYIPRQRKDNQNFYSGEALLFLATRYCVSRHPAELARIMAAFRYYRTWHRENCNPAFVPWHTQAYYLVWQVTKNEALKDFIFEMNDWLLSMQQWASAEHPDMQGRFYDPLRPYYGPPHASSTGVYLEGLIDAFALADTCGDRPRAENYRIAIVRGIRSLMQLQYKDTIDCFHIKHIDRVLGGVRTTVYDNTIRIDNVQHGLMALLKIAKRFSDADFKVAGLEYDAFRKNRLPKINGFEYFKKIDFCLDMKTIRQEVDSNSHLWLKNTSRQKNLKVQRETQTIFLRTANKPFPIGVSGNDIHLSSSTENSEEFPVLMRTLYEFARHVNGELSRVTVVRLRSKSRVYPHVDEGSYYKYRDRYHLVVYSPEGSEMISGGEKVVWKEGELWWFDNKAIHEASNNSLGYRVHVIFDVLPYKNKEMVRRFMEKTAESPREVVG